jgi:serralysin
VARFRSNLGSDIFDAQTDFDDPVQVDTAVIRTLGQSDSNGLLRSSSLATLGANLVAGSGEEKLGLTNPGLLHDSEPAATMLDAGTVTNTDAVQVSGADAITLFDTTSSSSGSFSAATPPSGSAAEIAFISGVTSSGTVAGTSFGSWEAAGARNPATYSSTFSWATKWGSTSLSASGTPGGTVTYWFDTASGWSAGEKNALASGLALWSAEANISFSLAASAASANFIFYRGSDGSAYQDFPNETVSSVGSSVEGRPGSGALISIDTSVAGFGPIGASFSTYGGYPYQTLVHEEGHMLGLGHGGPYNGSVNSATQQFSAYDSRLWSVMSYINPWDTSAKYYSSYPVTGTNWGTNSAGYYYEPTTPMILDILAAQQLYGAATSGPLGSGGQIFGFDSNISGSIASFFDFTVNTHPVVTIWDGGSNNTLDLSGWSTPATINLNPGTFSSANGEVNNIGIAAGTVIQKAIGGSGNDTFIVNSYNDTIDGGGGTNSVVFSGARSQYQVTKNANGSFHLVDLRSGSPDGTDEISNVQFFKFTDVTATPANLIPTVIEGFGSTDLDQVGSNYFLYAHATLSGPELKLGGAPVMAGQFGSWAPIGAEPTASGYEVAWKNAGAGQYSVWATDSNGNYTSNAVVPVSGTDYALESLEPSFHQDLNGDGQIGPPTTVIETNGLTHLTQAANDFFLYDTNGSGPSLKFAGANVAAGQFGAWTPIGAEPTASGYEVAWKNAGASQYSVWATDSNGNYTSNAVVPVSETDYALESLEPSFHQDLNGDGLIGPPTTVIETNGLTHLTQVANDFFLYDGGGSGPSLKFAGANVAAGQFGAWTPISAEATASGYEVAWKNAGADQYSVWATDSNGNYTSNAVVPVSGTDYALESLEPSFHQDLNGDGLTGPPTATEFATSSNAFSIALGPSGNLWFTEPFGNMIGEISPAGAVSEFAWHGNPGGIVSDGTKLWFTEIGGNAIGSITTSGQFGPDIPIPTANAFAHEIAVDVNGNIWFAEAGSDKIGELLASDHATIKEFAIPTAGGAPFDIVAGPDGNMWFTEIHSDKIGKITPAGAVTEFTVGDHPSYITAGPDGKMWFSESDTEQSSNPNKIGTINTDGSGFTEFSPPTAGSKPQGITTGSDGALWFTEESGNRIERLTTDGHFTEFAIPTGNSAPFGIVSGSDGNIWFTEFSGKIGEVHVPPTVTVPNSSVQATGGQIFQVSSLFSASDADHDTLTYTFYDTTPGNGHFLLNGLVQHDGDGKSFTVSAADLPNLTFAAGSSGSDTLMIGANDGHSFSGWHTLTVSVASHAQPAADALWHQLG